MADYQPATAEEENRRNPKNRFMFLFCHASEVDQSWGKNWSFGCGVVIFSIICGIMAIFDVSVTFGNYFKNIRNWFLFMFVIRFISNLITLTGIIFGIISIIQSSFQRATIAYYAMVISFLLNLIFCIYCIFRIFSADFWKKTTYRIVVWLLNEFVLLLFCWILFCNMVNIGRKNRQNAGATTF